MSFTDQELKNEIDSIFLEFDKDNSGTLDKAEVIKFINDTIYKG